MYNLIIEYNVYYMIHYNRYYRPTFGNIICIIYFFALLITIYFL